MAKSLLPSFKGMAEVLELEKFKKWAESKPPTSILGYVNGSTSCPIARYIKESFTTNYEVTVSSRSACLTNPIGYSNVYRLPIWASIFVLKFDEDNKLRMGKTVEEGLADLVEVERIMAEKRPDVGKDVMGEGQS